MSRSTYLSVCTVIRQVFFHPTHTVICVSKMLICLKCAWPGIGQAHLYLKCEYLRSLQNKCDFINKKPPT